MKKILIVEASTGGGHLSISDAIIEEIQDPTISIHRYDVAKEYWYRSFYQYVTRHSQLVYAILYHIGNHPLSLFIARYIPFFSIEHRLKPLLSCLKPDLIFINTPLAVYSIPPILKSLHMDIPTITFVADPFSVHAAFFHPDITCTCVSTREAYDIGKQYIPEHTLRITGHPIRKNFYTVPEDKKTLRKSLGLHPDMFTLFMGGSGDGADHALPLCELLIQRKIDTPIQILFMTGTNTHLKKTLDAYSLPEHVSLHTYATITDPSPYLHASDLAIGKAGPNMMFECCASEVPLLAIYHIQGQEDGNISFIRSSGIGFVEEKKEQAIQRILACISSPQTLSMCREKMKQIAYIHTDARKTIPALLNTMLRRYDTSSPV